METSTGRAGLAPHDRNRILNALPEQELRALLPELEVVGLQRMQVIADVGEPVAHAYFPHCGVVSLMEIMRDGGAIETTTVGPEGFVGFSTILGRGTAYGRNVVQVNGTASRISAERFRAAIAGETQLRRLVYLYVGAFLAQVMRSAACNALHTVEERCARWLLMTHDRARADEFELTQAFISEMLAVRRASVNLVSRSFQRAGLIEYSRGVIRILDRPGLEAVSCACYQDVRDVLDEVFILAGQPSAP